MITRRDFGKLAAGGAVAAAMPVPAVAQAQTRTGSRPTLTIAVDNLWSSMEPIFGISTTGRRIMPNFYDVLIERDYLSDPNGLKLQPKLATRWEQKGKVWLIELRQGVKFHNGAEMTAEDVAWTLSSERLWGPKPIAPRGKTFTSGFARVEATGKYTLEIETEDPDPHIPGKLTGYIGFVVPKKHYQEVGHEKFGQMPIGTGPYKVTTFRSGEVMVLDAFDDYWGEKAPAQRLVWKIVPEYAARMAGLVSGEFDMIVNVPTDQIQTIRGYKALTYTDKPADNYPAFAFNCRPDPVDNPLVDPRLRQAMVQGVNMPEIVKALFGDATFYPSVPFNFPEYGSFYDPKLPPRLAFDPAKAKAMVKQTKYDGQPLRWHITRSFYPNYESAAEIMVEQWRDIGVNVQAYVLDNFDLVYRRPYHLMNMSMNSNFIPGDPYQPLWLDWGPTATRSTASWKSWDPSPRFVEIGRQFERATDPAERKRLYLALSEEWQSITPGMYLWKSVYNWAHRRTIAFTPVADSDMRMYGGYLKIG